MTDSGNSAVSTRPPAADSEPSSTTVQRQARPVVQAKQAQNPREGEHEGERKGQQTETDAPKGNGEPLGIRAMIGSALAAGLGVQSSKNRKRDFEQGKAGAFIVAGIIFTALFIGGVYAVVSVVLAGR